MPDKPRSLGKRLIVDQHKDSILPCLILHPMVELGRVRLTLRVTGGVLVTLPRIARAAVEGGEAVGGESLNQRASIALIFTHRRASIGNVTHQAGRHDAMKGLHRVAVGLRYR
ncbi:hypothetical protein [Sphingomonas yabuuchiae]|uniref:hypothetical protein n=1 Tax=Sphingomonas yabuuchiae TaxID=172044 RepID=UPI003618B7A6